MKVFNDCVHGLIEVPSYYLIFIDTPVFQRLRNIKQLGAQWVYPTATHHRFEHSIGTAHLARLLMLHLKSSLGSQITDADVKCVELAGLLHDVGHGPFSHVWDAKIVPGLYEESDPEQMSYPHELASIELIDWMVDKYNLKEKLEEEGLSVPEHITFIKEIIKPDMKDKTYEDTDIRAFMYEIISNKYCELDVDKFDYLARDGKALGTFSLESPTDLQRLIRLTSVAQGSDGRYHLAFRDNVAMNVTNVFQLRHRLHRIAYQHKNTVAAEQMIADAIVKADPVFHFRRAYRRENGRWRLQISTYLKWTDHLFWQILNSSDDELAESRKILERVVKRQFYTSLLRTFVESSSKSVQRHKTEVKKAIGELTQDPEDKKLAEEALIILHSRYDFCKKNKNPLDKCVFLNKENERHEDNTHILSPMFMPKQICELEIRLYSRLAVGDSDTEEEKRRKSRINELLKEAFRRFCKNYYPPEEPHKLPEPQGF